MSAALSVRGVGKLHPDLTLRMATTIEQANHAQSAIEQRARHAIPVQTIGPDNNTGPALGNNRAWSNKLPMSALVCILKYHLLFKGQSVHAISRLDPFYKPHRVPRTRRGSPTYLQKFHIGIDPVSLTFAPRASILLAPLLVCRRWHYVGSTIFYGENTFAFSSLGE